MLKPHTLSVLQRCPAAGRRSKRCSPFLFREQFTFRVTNGRSDETAFAGKLQSSETPTAYAYGCRRSKETAEQGQQGTWRLITLKKIMFRQTPAGHETRRVWRAAFPKRQPEQVAAKRERDECLYDETIVPKGQETKSKRAANRRAGERVVSLEIEVSDFGFMFILSLGRGNIWKLTATQRSFRDWCSGGQETRSAWLPTTLKSCSRQQQELDVETVT